MIFILFTACGGISCQTSIQLTETPQLSQPELELELELHLIKECGGIEAAKF